MSLIAALCVLLPTSGDAAAKKKAKKATPIVGVGDLWPMFDDPNYLALKTKISRIVIPYDFYYRDPVALARTTAWLEGAKRAGVQPLVSIHHSEIPGYEKKLPSVAEYASSLKYLLKHYPWVKTISPWNEANHKTQPTVKNPKRAAQYYNKTRVLCKKCTIVAADVLDQKNLMPWLKTFQRYAKKPKIWGLHSYTDTNRNKSWKKSTTRQFLQKTKGDVWLTEVGGIVSFNQAYSYNENRAAQALKRTLDLGFKDKRIKRIYLYNWFGTMFNGKNAPAANWDSGLVNPDNTKRKGYTVLQNWLKKNKKATRKP